MEPEPQYEHDVEPTPLGKMMSQRWRDDPKMLGIVLARYKFVAKMLRGYIAVAEIGCGDGWASELVERAVGHLNRFDLDPRWGRLVHDITQGPLSQAYHAIYMLDVLEHIPSELTSATLDNLMGSLVPGGVAIIGMPSIEGQMYASAQSRAGHVNCMSSDAMRLRLLAKFSHVFMFGMNDETLHTGFGPMSHYLLALCVK